MTEIIGLLNSAVSDNNVWMVLLVIAVFLLLKVKTIVDFWEERRSAKISKIKEALECDSVSEMVREHFEQELEAEYFRQISGLKYDKQIRLAIVSAHQQSQGELGFRHFRQCKGNYGFKNGKLLVDLGFLDWWMGIGGLLGAVYLFFSGLLLMGNSYFAYEGELKTAISQFLMGLFFIPMAYWMLLQFAKLISLRYVSKELAKQAA